MTHLSLPDEHLNWLTSSRFLMPGAEAVRGNAVRNEDIETSQTGRSSQVPIPES